MTRAAPFEVAPRVRLIAAFDRPYEHAVAAARTCYSGKGVASADDVSGVGAPDALRGARQDQRDRIAQATWRAGHHTVFQHGHVSFALDGVSRQFVWSFLHSHPFYNSEQVSQRYVEVRAERAAIPALDAPARAIYRACVAAQHEAYLQLVALIEPAVAARYFATFPARGRRPDRWTSAVHRRAQEVARAVLPVATHTWMIHTVSVLTLLRYWRVVDGPDAPAEARLVVGEMVRQLLDLDPLLARLEVEPASDVGPAPVAGGAATRRAMAAEFDARLGERTSVLVDRFAANERRVADAVREVLGLPEAAIGDADAIACALDPAANPRWGDSLNTGVHLKLGRALHAAHYLFAKKLSHAADSQDQRHRMTPASRPLATVLLSDDPDVIVPALIAEEGGRIAEAFHAAIGRTWEAIGRLRAAGVAAEWQAYLLPNAVAVRLSTSCDLQALRHKLAMRLCFNAQDEIWRASVDEAEQIAAVEPAIGQWLLPPCGVRFRAGARPICPEGDRYCGVPAWQVPMAEWQRRL